MRFARTVGLVALGGVIAACSGGSTDAARIEQRLGLRIDSLSKRIDSLASDIRIERTISTFDEEAFLKPGDGGYAVVKTNLGVLTFRLQNVQQYANGSRVELQVGNVTSATITGLNISVDYGPTDTAGIAVFSEEKSKKVTFSESLPAGSWTTLPVVLDNVPPSNLGFVRIYDVSHQGIRLLKP